MTDKRDTSETALLVAGPTRARMLYIASLLVILLLGGSFVALIGLGLIVSGEGPFVGVFLFGGVIIDFVMIVGLLLDLGRNQYWIDGTTVVERRIRSNRRRDLLTEPIRADETPRLIIGETGTRPMVLPLRDPYRNGKPIAAHHLRALADIVSNRPDGSDEGIRDIAEGLREMAADPFGLRH
ncbi:hypothetical protein J4573_29595 [Actinomadura barringtoniae]|uniref:Uncharacterized protein n=1 Tax=Actinomadura barringtoniae TaxID=1427535 RepID=A0A939PEV6_9ACTN|nr:hypothetical protein [Actinomadura barringtoniae]MBO2451280.1 hypothetical protein [Actinomadura barringtoniae]